MISPSLIERGGASADDPRRGVISDISVPVVVLPFGDWAMAGI